MASDQPPTGDALASEPALAVARLLRELGPGATPEELAAAHEGSLGSARRGSGAFYTPEAVVDFVLRRTLDPLLDVACRSEEPQAALLALRICDPACGAGAFLLAAARRLAARLAGVRAHDAAPSAEERARALADVLATCVFGAEHDPVTAAVCRAVLALEAGGDYRVEAALETAIVVGDALLLDWQAALPGPWAQGCGGFDAVVGNPPFLNRLETATAPDRARAAELTARWGAAAARYSDAATIFLLLARDLTRPGGRFALVQPASLLAAQDARAARDLLAVGASLDTLWFSAARLFDANVEVVVVGFVREQAPVLRIERWGGQDFAPLPARALPAEELRAAETWAPLAAPAVGIPEVVLRAERTLGDYCEATADFRDQYYGLVPAVVDFGEGSALDDPRFAGGGFAPLVTTALVDLAHCAWGERPTRFAKERWHAPVVDLELLAEDVRLAEWAQRRRVPKALLATQTRVLEVVVDERGDWLPGVPLVTVVPREADALWHVAAALGSPELSAWAAARYLGAALHSDRIKLAARQVAALPAPAEGREWDRAAEAFRAASYAADADARRAALEELAERLAAAYGLRDSALAAWWSSRVR